jgi:SAM-dependent methyltransferase
MRCKICNSKKINIYNADETYYNCLDCDFIFKDDKEYLSSAEEKNRYASHNNTIDNIGYVKMFDDFINEIILPVAGNIETILDFGCGPGPVLSELLKKKNFKVDIYDPYFYPNDSYKQKKYDMIVSTEVFEHLKNPLAEIKSLLTLLNPDSYIAIMTNFHPGIDNFSNWWYKKDPTHLSFYNETTFEKISNILSLNFIYSLKNKYCLLKFY